MEKGLNIPLIHDLTSSDESTTTPSGQPLFTKLLINIALFDISLVLLLLFPVTVCRKTRSVSIVDENRIISASPDIPGKRANDG